MALGINTNLASLSAQRALNNTQADTNTAMQRLSTGLRINSAKDDAAGMAVASRFTSQINGMQQASRNASDAVSMLQSAEGGLQSITDNLQRIRELAVQAASDSITDTDRGYLDTEVQALVTEINRVADTTKYNGTALLDGDSGGFTFQVGADNSTNDRMAVSIADFNTAAVGQTSELTGVVVSAYVAGNGGTGTQTQGSLSVTLTVGGTDHTIATAAGANVDAAAMEAQIEASVGTSSAAGSIAALSGVTVSGDNTAGMTFTDSEGREMTVKYDHTVSTGFDDDSTFTDGIVTTSDTTALASGAASTAATAVSGTTVGELSVTSQANARTAMDIVDRALNDVNEGRASMGALQSRFESVVSNLNLGAENATAGRSRVQDADFAVESANLAKNQVLQQAGMSVLAQANALPQQVLALLQ